MEYLVCTKDGCEEPRADQDPEATNRHCRKHRAEAQRAFQATKLEQQHGKGFGKGVQAMRDLLVEQFAEQGSAGFSGYEIAALIAQCAGPSPKD
jgi:hypothetical protein